MKIRLLFLCLLFVPGAYGWAHDKASEQAHHWLTRMANAVKTLNYEGVFIYVHDRKIEAMHIIHRADASGEQERLLSLNGAAREIIRDNSKLICILPDSRSVVVEKSRSRKYIPSALLNAGRQLEKYYHYRLLSSGRVTGREAQIVAVIPRDAFRYGYRLWIDQKTGLLLMTDLINEKGRVVEQVMFTWLKVYKSIPPARIAQTIRSDGYKRFQQKTPATAPRAGRKKSAWKVMKLPKGYMLSMHVRHRMPTSRMPVEHMMFSDGLSSVSVYIEKPSGKPMLRGGSRMGAVNAWGTRIRGYNVTVVGEVPRATVRMIGKSIRFRPDK
jgi:sigma-E factor negative regulatory protein RseB